MTTKVSSVLKELCSAPLEAAVEAESEYRRIWLKWLQGKQAMIKNLDDETKAGINWHDIFAVAPAITVNSTVDLAISMRVASVKEVSAEGQIGLSIGPVHASGGFGFVNRSTSESTLQAATSIVLSNNEQNLLDYLGKHNIVPSKDKLETAINFLKKPVLPKSETEE